jgi:uncharacterized phage protein gp47/JayE
MGSDRETDENYRYRISKRLEGVGGATVAGLRAAVLTVPGVRDVEVTANSRGPGTVTIHVIGAVNPTSSELLARVHAVALQNVAAGIVVDVRNPQEIPVQLRMVVSPDSSSLRQAVKGQVAQMFANMSVDDILQVSDLVYMAYLAGADDAAVLWLQIDGREVPLVNQYPIAGTRFYLDSIEVEPR